MILGGHGITAWGDTSAECEANSIDIIRTAEAFLASRGIAEPFGPVVPGFEALPETERHARAAALAPVVRGLASTDQLYFASGHLDLPGAMFTASQAASPALYPRLRLYQCADTARQQFVLLTG